MLDDDLHGRCLREAIGAFPEGCTCEDNLDCRFCRYVVAIAMSARQQAAEPCRTGEPCDEGSTFVIPVSEDAQVYELRRLFHV